VSQDFRFSLSVSSGGDDVFGRTCRGVVQRIAPGGASKCVGATPEEALPSLLSSQGQRQTTIRLYLFFNSFLGWRGGTEEFLAYKLPQLGIQPLRDSPSPNDPPTALWTFATWQLDQALKAFPAKEVVAAQPHGFCHHFDAYWAIEIVHSQWFKVTTLFDISLRPGIRLACNKIRENQWTWIT
jgi:hypothetical protein